MYNWVSKEGKTGGLLQDAPTLLGGQVTVSDKEVRVWICENGMCVFRLMVLGGKIRLSEYENGKQVEITVTQEEKKSV
jgi:hypothetical protein